MVVYLRTDMMKKAVTKLGLKFEQGTAEPNIWRVLDKAGNLCGLIAVYVDDYLVAAPKEVCQDVHDWFSSTWQTTEVQFATPESSLRFLGMEMRVVLNDAGDFEGYSLDQEGYIQEVLRHHEVGERQVSTIPAAKDWMSLDPSTFPESYDDQSLKDPERAAMIGRKALSYLNQTKGWKLRYKANQSPALIAYTDSSYAPDGCRSHGGAVVFWSGAPVAWRSGRQALITTSSAETELLAASEGTTLMASIDALLHDVGAHASSRELRVDNSAAITLASEEGGSWRTRHLKVRAGALRQRIQDGWMKISFCPGIVQLADGLTKILPARRMNDLMRAWGLGSLIEEGNAVDLQPPQQVRQLQAPAELPQQQDTTQPATQGLSPENLGCCLQLLVLMSSLTKVRGYRTADDDASPLAVDSSLELYGIILMLVICTIALWELGRSCYRSHNEGVRLRSLQTDAKLSKKELRILNSYLKRRPTDLSEAERDEMVTLADQAGVDLTGILQQAPMREPESSSKAVPEEYQPPPPPPPPIAEACAADEELVYRRRRERNWMGTHRGEEPFSMSSVRRPPIPPRTREAWVQCDLGGEVPKKVYMTPKGTCVHASVRCPTLNCSTKFQERDVCQRCIKGQKEEVDVRGAMKKPFGAETTYRMPFGQKPVMSSQAAEADALLPQDRRGRAVLEGESAGPAYGSADVERQGAPEAPPVVFQRNQLRNGVAPRGDQADRTRSPMRPDRSAGRPLEPPQRGQAVEAGHGQVALGNPSPDSSVFASVDSRDTMTISPPRVGDEPHQTARTLQMEYATYDNGEGVATSTATGETIRFIASGSEKVVFTRAGENEIFSCRHNSMEYHMVIGLQRYSREYRMAIGLQCSSVEYHLVIGLQRYSMEYCMAIGLQCSSVEYHMVIGLQRCSMEYRMAIGLQRSGVEYHMVIVLQSSMEYYLVIGLQSSMEYH
ncbi:unnamed protein product, partial [Symbiodinium sp. KB8]